MTNKPARTCQKMIKLRDELTKVVSSIAPIAAIDIFNIKEYSYDRCPDPFYFDTLLLIIYLSAIETLICHKEIEFNRVYFLRFCTKYHTWFSNYHMELIVALSSINATKNIYGYTVDQFV